MVSAVHAWSLLQQPWKCSCLTASPAPLLWRLSSRHSNAWKRRICVRSTFSGEIGWVIFNPPAPAYAESSGRLSLRVHTLSGDLPLTITQGGVHCGAPSPCAATPPRLALSGALVLNAGYEYSQLPAALWSARTQTCCMEPREDLQGWKRQKFREVSWKEHAADNHEGNVSQVLRFSFLMRFYLSCLELQNLPPTWFGVFCYAAFWGCLMDLKRRSGCLSFTGMFLRTRRRLPK